MIRHCKILIDPAARVTIICRNKTEGGGTEQDFLTLARQRLDRIDKHRTMSFKKVSLNTTSSNQLNQELSKIESSVDCIAGILSKRKIGNQSTATREPIGIQSQRDRSNNLDKVLCDVPDSSYFPEDVPPFNCQFTKELEIRDCKGEDKLLKFPIDNQDVVWEESHVPFSDHIFLNKYLVLFPAVTRPFMETIITALQNNPDLTLDKKKEIIWSYLNYFDYHSDLLEEDEEEILKI